MHRRQQQIVVNGAEETCVIIRDPSRIRPCLWGSRQQ